MGNMNEINKQVTIGGGPLLRHGLVVVGRIGQFLVSPVWHLDQDPGSSNCNIQRQQAMLLQTRGKSSLSLTSRVAPCSTGSLDLTYHGHKRCDLLQAAYPTDAPSTVALSTLEI